MQTRKKHKTFIKFYAIDLATVYRKGLRELYDDYVCDEDKIRIVKCNNIFEFDATRANVIKLLKEKDFQSQFFSDIKAEYDGGANVMFVTSGRTVVGLFIKNLFSKRILNLSEPF